MAERPDWDTYFLDMARLVSTRSTCPRAEVGAVLVIDRRIIATGYNGAAPGLPHCTEAGCLIEDSHCQRVIHAEVNAVGQAAKMGISADGATLYMYDSNYRTEACRECRKALLTAGVAAVIVAKEPPEEYYRLTPLGLISAELARARSKFPGTFASPHEGFAILKEEVDELWDAVKANDKRNAKEEAIQVGAMALRFLEDCYGKE